MKMSAEKTDTEKAVKHTEWSQNTILLASTQAVYKAPHRTVREHSVVRSQSEVSEHKA